MLQVSWSGTSMAPKLGIPVGGENVDPMETEGLLLEHAATPGVGR